jgi:hypothetical protein
MRGAASAMPCENRQSPEMLRGPDPTHRKTTVAPPNGTIRSNHLNTCDVKQCANVFGAMA